MSEFKRLPVRNTNITWSSYIYSLNSPREQRNCTILYGYGDYIGSIYRVTTFLFFLKVSFLKKVGGLNLISQGNVGLVANYHIMTEFKRQSLTKKNISWPLYIYSLYSPRDQRNCTILYGYGDYIGSIYRVTTFLFCFLKLVFKEGGRLEFDFSGKCGVDG